MSIKEGEKLTVLSGDSSLCIMVGFHDIFFHVKMSDMTLITKEELG